MAKYDPLRDFLKQSGARSIRIPLFFLEQMVGPLPRAAYRHAAWWANGDQGNTRHVQCKAWREAGYIASIDRTFPAVTFVAEAV